MPDIEYRTTASELTSIADAIREKGGTSESLVYPNGFVDAIGNIQTGGGNEQLYIFVADVPYSNTSANTTSGGTLTARKVFYGPALVSGVTVNFLTFGDYILKNIIGLDSGSTYSFTTVQRGQYTFTMPSESVECNLLYDD